MKTFSEVSDPELISILRAGGIGVLRTDTLYGLVGRADNEQAVRRIYEAKRRSPDKSPIVLIAHLSDMFDRYEEAVIRRIGTLWPGKNSIILPSTKAPEWIARDNHSVAYRVPNDPALRVLLRATGPLIAPSANPEMLDPAMTMDEAKAYFKESVDFYVDGGNVTDKEPSKLFLYNAGELKRLR